MLADIPETDIEVLPPRKDLTTSCSALQKDVELNASHMGSLVHVLT